MEYNYTITNPCSGRFRITRYQVKRESEKEERRIEMAKRRKIVDGPACERDIVLSEPGHKVKLEPENSTVKEEIVSDSGSDLESVADNSSAILETVSTTIKSETEFHENSHVCVLTEEIDLSSFETEDVGEDEVPAGHSRSFPETKIKLEAGHQVNVESPVNTSRYTNEELISDEQQVPEVVTNDESINAPSVSVTEEVKVMQKQLSKMMAKMNKYKKLNRALKHKKKEIKSLQKRVEERDAENKNLSDLLNKFIGDNAKLVTYVQKLEHVNGIKNKLIQESIMEISKLKQFAREKEEKNDDAKKVQEKSNIRTNVLAHVLKENHDKLSKTEQLLMKYIEENKSLQSTLNAKDSAIDVLYKLVSDKEEENASMQITLKEKERDNRNLMIRLTVSNNRKDKAVQLLEESRMEIENLKERLEKVEMDCHVQQNFIADLSPEVLKRILQKRGE